MSRRIIIGFFLIFSLLVPLQAMGEADGGLPGAYLRFGASSRSLGMGGLDVVLGRGAEAAYGNPAQVGLLEPLEFSVTHASLWEGSSYDILTGSWPGTKLGGLSLGVVSLRCGGFERRGPLDNRYSIRGEEFSDSQTAVLVGLGSDLARMAWSSSLGGRLKLVNHSMLDESVFGFGMDFGLEHRMVLPYFHRLIAPLTVGLHASNLIAPSVRLKDESESFPRRLNLGLGYSVGDLASAGFQVCLAGQGSRRIRAGFEIVPRTELSLRVGVNSSEISGGVGFLWQEFRIDYAAAWHSEFSTSHRLSLAWTRERPRRLEKEGQIPQYASRWIVQNYSDPEAARVAHLISAREGGRKAGTYYRFVTGQHSGTVWAAHGWRWFGDRDYESSNWKGAEKNLLKLFFHPHRENAASPESWFRLGDSSERLEHWSAAVDGYELVMASEPVSRWKEESFFRAGAVYYLFLLDYDNTVRIYEEAVREYPERDLSDAYYHLGRAYAGLERWQSSVERLKFFFSKYSGDSRIPSAIFWIGRGLYQLGLPEDALPRLEEVVEGYPEHEVADDALLFKGHCYRLQGNLAMSRLEYSRVVKDYPARESAALAQLALAMVLEEEGSIELARREFQRFMANYPSHPGGKEALEHLEYLGKGGSG